VKLVSIQLENIRSHKQSVVTFADGFNCLVGGLGQGKSTVLYAFDFALFGDPLSRSYDYLLREGAEQGKVTAVFVQNGETYKIERALQRRGKGISQDTDQLKFYRNGKLLASNKNDAVAEEFKALTGLDKNVFREVVWVRQEHLKELLDITPRVRQKKLDQLFGLSDYEAAWSNLHQFEREYEVEMNVLERDADVVNISKLEDDYLKAVEEFSSVTAQLEEAKDKVAEAEAALKEATSRLEGLEELQRKTEALHRKEIQLQTNLSNIEKRLKEMTLQTETEKMRIHSLEEQLAKMEKEQSTQLETLLEVGVDADKPIDKLGDQLFALEEQLRAISVEQETTRREMQTAQSRVSNLLAESRCPTCLQDLSGEYKKNLLESLQKENAEREKRLTELQENHTKLKNIHRRFSVAYLSLRQLIPRIEDVKHQLKEHRETLRRLSEEIKYSQNEEKKLKKEHAATREKISKFDLSELESARQLQKSAYTQHLNAVHTLEQLERRKKDLAVRVDDLKERLDNAHAKMERKQKIGKLLGILDRIRVAYRNIQPKLRSELVRYLQLTVQQVLDSLVGEEGFPLTVKIDDSYSPFVRSEEGHEREVSNLSGGERTLLAFSYRIGLGQLIMRSRTGHGLHMLLLDEPTESLGREDGSVDRLAEAISRLKTIEQIIAVTHNEAFAEKAEHVIRIEKEAGASQVYIEK